MIFINKHSTILFALKKILYILYIIVWNYKNSKFCETKSTKTKIVSEKTMF